MPAAAFGALSLVLGFAACSDSAGPTDQHLIPLAITYDSRGARPGVERPPAYQSSAYLTVEGASLTVTTSFYGDLCGISPEASLVRVGEHLALTLKLPPVPGAESTFCPQWIAETDVTATAESVPPGRYRVTLRVDYPKYGSSDWYQVGVATIE